MSSVIPGFFVALGAAALLAALFFLWQSLRAAFGVVTLGGAEALDLRDAGNPDRIGGRDAAYHAKVAAAFARFAEAEPARFARIDGDGDADQVHTLVMAALDGLPE